MSLILNGTDGLSDVDGTAATPAIRGTDANTGIFFPAADTIAFSEGGAEAMRINSSGNVGIGTSSPAYRLDVRSASAIINLEPTTATDGTYFRTANTGGYLFVGRDSSTGNSFGTAYAAVIASSGAYPMTFFTNATERMRIDSSGNLLVGQTSAIPTNGAVGVGMAGGANAGSLRGQGGAGYNFAIWYNSSNSAVIGSIANSGGTATAYNTSSDYRLKENIAPMTGALDRVAALKPVTYKWKVDGSDGQGFIAHELQAVVPDCVTGEKDAVDAEGKPVYQGIDTSFLVATLTASIQELKAIVDAQAARIAALESAGA